MSRVRASRVMHVRMLMRTGASPVVVVCEGNDCSAAYARPLRIVVMMADSTAAPAREYTSIAEDMMKE